MKKELPIAGLSNAFNGTDIIPHKRSASAGIHNIATGYDAVGRESDTQNRSPYRCLTVRIRKPAGTSAGLSPFWRQEHTLNLNGHCTVDSIPDPLLNFGVEPLAGMLVLPPQATGLIVTICTEANAIIF